MNRVLVVPWSMAATYTSSPSPAMIPLAGTAGQRSAGEVREQRLASVEGGPEAASNKSVAVGSWTPERRGEREFIGEGRIRLGGRRGEGGRGSQWPSRCPHCSCLSAPRRDLVGRDGILGVRAPKKLGFFFFLRYRRLGVADWL
jgi:hypothetical protein